MSHAGLDTPRSGLLFRWLERCRKGRYGHDGQSGRRIYQRFLRFKGLAFSSTAGTFFGHPFSPVACKKATRVLRLTVEITCRFLNTRGLTIRIVTFICDILSQTISFKCMKICPLCFKS